MTPLVKYRHKDDTEGQVYFEATSGIGWAVFVEYPNGSIWMMRYSPEQWRADIESGALVRIT
jgi:hypothetical protein